VLACQTAESGAMPTRQRHAKGASNRLVSGACSASEIAATGLTQSTIKEALRRLVHAGSVTRTEGHTPSYTSARPHLEFPLRFPRGNRTRTTPSATGF
jgi:hypothetical protein